MASEFIKLEPGEHSFLGPSSAKRWFNCPGQPHFGKGFENNSGKAAAEGTVAHWVGEQALANGAYAHQWLGFQVQSDEFTFTVDEELTDAVQVYVDYVRSLAKTKDGEVRARLLEHQFDLSFINPELGGTGDCMVYDAKHIDLVDYKHGRGVWVDVKNNLQMRTYALGAIDHVWKVLLKKEDIKKFMANTITTTIVQPRINCDEGLVRSQTYTWGEIYNWAKKELKTACDAVKPGALINAGDHCTFCPCQGGCPVYKEWVSKEAKLSFDDVPADPVAKVKALTPEELNSFLRMSTRIRDLINAAERHAQVMAEKGRMTFDDFKLIRRGTQRKWVDNPEVEKELVALLKDEAFTKKIVSPAKADKLLGKDKSKIEDLWEKAEGGLLLVPRDDKRPEVVGESRTEFLDTHDLLQ